MIRLALAGLAAIALASPASSGGHEGNPVYRSILEDPVFADYTRIEFRERGGRILVEASGGGGGLERVYSAEGVLLSEERHAASDRADAHSRDAARDGRDEDSQGARDHGRDDDGEEPSGQDADDGGEDEDADRGEDGDG